MAKSSKKSSDRKRVSGQTHEIAYTGSKVARATGKSKAAGKKAVKKAKAGSRKVSRRKVETRAKRMA